MDSEKISRKLVELRGAQSRANVAQSIGISVSTLAMYESGARIPRDENKEKIAAFYGRTVQDIFFG